MITTPVTGSARLSEDGKTLTITTQPKRRKKPLVVTYTVERLDPDPEVANPAFRLLKEDGEFYDVHVDEWGPMCSCPHATFRGANSKVPCKHVLALQAVRLIPK